MGDVFFPKHDLMGVTTKEGKATFQVADNKETNKTSLNKNKPLRSQNIEQIKPQEAEQEKEGLDPSTQILKPHINPRPPGIPFPNRLRKEKEEAQQQKFLENLRQLHINIVFTEALVQMPKYAKYIKGLLTNKSRLKEACTITMNERCLALLLN
nr:hypothetical protein [Tanacetum cinerariifolium]